MTSTMCFHRRDEALSCLTMTFVAVEAAAVGISGAAAVLTGIGVVVLPGIATSGVGIGLGKEAAVEVSVTLLDD